MITCFHTLLQIQLAPLHTGADANAAPVTTPGASLSTPFMSKVPVVPWGPGRVVQVEPS
jgi:hypothetical protein